ncbi:hypothetical protein V8G54_018427 [Vigna mungo]|uniref:GAG-pre-integrase domain-containing protein n=1 Tax=Vigna mungo TaxID=3915 RepID=A0AAQ3N976_VIGMU
MTHTPLLHGTIDLGIPPLLYSHLFSIIFLCVQMNSSNQIATHVKLAKVINFISMKFICIDSSASWHHRLGHPSSSIFTFIQHHFSLCSNEFRQSNCNSCQISKSHKLHFHESTLKSSHPLEIIFSDV